MPPLHAIRLSALTAIAGLCLSSPALAEELDIPVPNSDFETAANDGSIGGFLPLFSASTSAVPLNGGPWEARSYGLLGLLAVPRVTIASNGTGNGTCEIASLAGVNVLGSVLSNRASVSQTLSVAAEPQAIYTLEADIDRSSLLTAGVLSQNGVGVALTINNVTVATSLNGAAPLLTVELLAGTRYRVKVHYVTGETPPAGNLGIRLFSGEGAALLSAGVLPSVTFDNIKLTVSLLES
jgi:hypothetical protein